MKYEIKNRWTQKAQYTAEIDCDESVEWRVKLGLAAKIAYLHGADLRGANLNNANMCGAYLRGADLYNANMRGADLLGADLSGANMRGAGLSGIDLRGADLSNANMCGADLSYADLGGANLRGADLRGACLSGAGLYGANLCGAGLYGANLYSADLRGAGLYGAGLSGLIVLARATRSDGHEYFAWTSILGGLVIQAGCRTWIGEDAIEQAREHCQTVTAERYRAEALRIVGFIEGAATVLRRDAA
jgi:hypothetical protein